MYDAQGNAFDRAILGVRIGAAIQAHLADPAPLRHEYPTPTALQALYEATHYAVTQSWPRTDGHLVPSPLLATGTTDAHVTRFSKGVL